MKNTFIGQPMERREDMRFLRGRGEYVDDVAIPGLLYAVILRSSVAHGRLISIDASAALAVPGVHSVITGADMPGGPPIIPMRLQPLPEFKPFEQPVIAHDKVRYVGEPIAVVLAASVAVGEDALDVIEVEIEDLPPVADWQTASANKSVLFETQATNRSLVFQARKGDADAAFAKAAHVFKQELWQHRGGAHSIETRGILAEVRSTDGGITVHASTQKAHDLQQTLTTLLDMDESLRVAAPDIGGGFGAKLCVYSEDVAVVAAAKLLGRSIKWTEDRREYFTNAVHERDQYWALEIAADAEMAAGLPRRLLAGAEIVPADRR